MIPNHDLILAATQRAIERKGKSCLKCMHFQFRERGEQIVCTRRLNIVEPTATITPGRLALADRRASKCKLYEGDDD